MMLKDELVQARKNRIIVCEDMDFVWDEFELQEIISFWKRGIGVIPIADHFGRDPDEVLIAVIHLARQDKINDANFGIGELDPNETSKSIWSKWKEIAGKHNITKDNFRARLKKGMVPEEAATAPLSKRGRKGGLKG